MSAIRCISSSVRECTWGTVSPMVCRYGLLITRTANVLLHVSMYACASGCVEQETASPPEVKCFQTCWSCSRHMGYQHCFAGSSMMVYCTIASSLLQQVRSDVDPDSVLKVGIGLCYRCRYTSHVLVS